MRMSSDGAKALVVWEAVSLVAYADPSGQDKTFSIAVGNQKPLVRSGDVIDLPEAWRRMRVHLTANDGWLSNLLKPRLPVPQWTWDAICSFTYNENAAHVEALAKAIVDKGVKQGCLEMAKYDKGKDGIAVRRTEEIFRCTHNWYGDISVFKLYQSDPRTSAPMMVPFPETI
jgi:GH24 family phage-related lysozyme (muramidase)